MHIGAWFIFPIKVSRKKKQIKQIEKLLYLEIWRFGIILFFMSSFPFLYKKWILECISKKQRPSVPKRRYLRQEHFTFYMFLVEKIVMKRESNGNIIRSDQPFLENIFCFCHWEVGRAKSL